MILVHQIQSINGRSAFIRLAQAAVIGQYYIVETYTDYDNKIIADNILIFPYKKLSSAIQFANDYINMSDTLYNYDDIDRKDLRK